MINYNTTTIEELAKQNEQLKVIRKKIEDKTAEANSNLETKINAYNTKIKALNDKANRNRKVCKNKIAQIDRLIKENNEQIKTKVRLGKQVVDEIKEDEDDFEKNEFAQIDKKTIQDIKTKKK